VELSQEHEWVMKAKEGDDAAFARIVEAYQRPIYNLAYRMLGGATEAEDAAQEVFLRAYTHLDSYAPSYKFSSWILSIASHYCIDLLRKCQNQSVSMEEIDGLRWIPNDSPRPEPQALERDQERSIRRLLAELPEHYRLAVVLHYWEGLSYEEIAEVTDDSESAIKSRLYRARRRLAELLTEDGVIVEALGHEQRRAAENAP